MAKRPTTKPKNVKSKKRGPKEERLVITSDPGDAVARFLASKKKAR